VAIENRTNGLGSDFTLLALNRSSGEWQPVKIGASGRWAASLGSNGNELAFSMDGSSYSTIHFFTLNKK